MYSKPTQKSVNHSANEPVPAAIQRGAMRVLIMASLSVTIGLSCGQSGPLVLPDDAKKEASAQSTAAPPETSGSQNTKQK